MTRPSVPTALFLFVCLSWFATPGPLAGNPGSELTIAPDTNIIPPQIISKTQAAPVFPPAAQAGRFSGIVTVEVLIDVTGRVAHAHVVSSTHTNVGFEEAALEAVRKWQFHPAEHNGDPVPYKEQFDLTFDRRGTGILTPALLEGGPRSDFRHPVRWQSLDSTRNRASRPGSARRTPAVSGGTTGAPTRR